MSIKKAAYHLLWWHSQMGIHASPIIPAMQDKETKSDNAPTTKHHALERLRQDLNAFQGCALSQGAQNMVFGDGNPDAPVMLVGEAPGAEEDKQGKPFVGASGKLLDAMLKSVHMDRSCVYITNTVPWRPPNNRQPTEAERAACLPFLQRHIAIVAPRLLMCVGGTAYKTLLSGPASITQSLSMNFHYMSPCLNQPIPAFTLYHPAYLMRCPGKKKEAWHQLLRIQKFLNNDH